MTQDLDNLRDTRLKRALAHAPDAQDMPAQAIRNAIKNKASHAVRTKANAHLATNPPWWKRFWASTGRAGGPWNTAFATVVLGSIITLIWHGQDLPDAVLDKQAVALPRLQDKTQAAAISVGPAVQAPPAPATAPAPVIEPAQPTTAKSPPAAKPPKAARPRVDAPVSSGVESRVAEIAQSATAPATAPAGVAAAPPPGAPAPAPAPAQSLGRAPVLADQARSAAKMAAAAPTSAAVMPLQWDALEVTYRGQTARLSKAESQALTAQVQALVASAVDLAALLPSTKPTLQLKWYAANGTGATEVATFSLWAGRFAWQVGGNAAIEGVALSDPLDTLLASINRVLPP